jgi:hypothetical protein
MLYIILSQNRIGMTRAQSSQVVMQSDHGGIWDWLGSERNRAFEGRRHEKIHNRYIFLNDHCWIVGSALKAAGKKTFTMKEHPLRMLPVTGIKYT